MKRGSVLRGGARAIRGGVMATALLAAATPALAQGTLSDITVYSTTSSGAFNFSDYYNTRTGDFVYNIYVSTTANGSNVLNPSATLSTPLALGTNTFYLFGDPGSRPDFYGFNLFLDGGTTPFISGYAATNGGTVLSNQGQVTFEGTRVGINPPLTVQGAGTTFAANGFLYTLTDFSFNTTQQFGDIASPLVLGPNGSADYFGTISISVAPITVGVVPEPSTVVLMASGLLGVLGVTIRRRRAVVTA